MNVSTAQKDLRSQIAAMPGTSGFGRVNSSQRYASMKPNQNTLLAQQQPKKETFKTAGGGELKVDLPVGVKKDVLSDALLKAIDQAMVKPENKALKNDRVIITNKDPKAKLNRTFKTAIEVNGFTPAKLPDHGVSDIHFNNASGKMPTSKYGKALISAKNSNFDNSNVENGVILTAVGDNNSMKNSKGKISGEVLAHSTNSTFTGGKNGLAAKGMNVELGNSSVTGNTKASLDAVAHPSTPAGHGPAVIHRDVNFNPRQSAWQANQKKFGALPAPTGSIMARKREHQFPQLNAA